MEYNKIPAWAAEAERRAAHEFARFEDISALWTERILDSFRHHRVSDGHFHSTSGYGYDEVGRDTLDKIWAQVFGAEDALVRVQFVNGTHAIACALRAACPGGGYLSLVGEPYDTLRGVMPYESIGTLDGGMPDYEAISQRLSFGDVPAVLIQRSRGYSGRHSLSADNIKVLIDIVRVCSPNSIIVADNCYGEFCDAAEPPALGADLTAGSLIKNPGGGLAVTGGYIAGRADLVGRAAEWLTVPGIGRECGGSLGQNRLLYQGLFLAPHTVCQARKTAAFAAYALDGLGYAVSPGPGQERNDIIQSIAFGDPDKLLAFVRGIQAASPVDGFVTPEPWGMPGYDDPVVMAAGTFVQGASIELSCDAPMREPYRAFLQGGLTYESGRLGIIRAIRQMLGERP